MSCGIVEQMTGGKFQPGVLYYWKRTDGWNWFGEKSEKMWWEVFIEFYDGCNGGGGAFVMEHWRWNGSPESVRTELRNLSVVETRTLVQELLPHLEGSHD